MSDPTETAWLDAEYEAERRRRAPWQDLWEVVAPLGAGGQGETRLVERVSDRQLGVLKTLHEPADEKGRLRMRQEVTNLETIGGLGGRVPKVLWHNADQVENSRVGLGMVMEFVEGPTLRKVVDNKLLSFDEAVPLILSLCETVELGHKEGIVHRDLKPENLIVRGNDVVVLDYGISFNKAEDAGLTESSEAFKNKFLFAPETMGTSPNKRDPRTDLLAIACLLYFCMTGKNVGHPLDLEKRPPHLRPDPLIRDLMASDARRAHVEQFLSTGSAHHVAERFQAIEELVSRLQQAASAPTVIGQEDPISVAREISHQIEAGNRKAILHRLSDTANSLFQHLRDQRLLKDLPGFQVQTSMQSVGCKPDEEGRQILKPVCSIKLWNSHVPLACHLRYRVSAKGRECVFQRAAWTTQNKDDNPDPLPWGDVFWFCPENSDADAASWRAQAERDLQDWCIESMRAIGAHGDLDRIP